MDNLGIWQKLPNKLFAVGDIHGDFNILEHVLIDLAEVCKLNKNNELEWIDGADSWIIFCGDLIDRLRKRPGTNITVDDENSDKKIILKLINLNKEAEKSNGKIIVLLGNHELLNFEHAFDYVSQEGSYQGRKKDFTRGSDFSEIIAENTFLTAKIGNWVFVHGGFCPDAFKNNDYLKKNPIHKLNYITRKFLVDKYYFKNSSNTNQEKHQMRIILDALYGIDEEKSPLNCRHYGFNIDNQESCESEVVSKVFKYIFNDNSNGKMVISHTPQFIYNMNINRSCGGKVWRLDTGMSRGFDEHYKFITDMIKKTGIKIIKQLNALIKHDKYRYISILEISDSCEKIVTQHKFARDTINEKRIKHSEAIFTKYRLIQLIKSIESNELKLNTEVENQKEEIILNIQDMIKYLDDNNTTFIKDKKNVCLIDYD
jgi:hypothetical protein